jgi:hypothetical protein
MDNTRLLAANCYISKVREYVRKPKLRQLHPNFQAWNGSKILCPCVTREEENEKKMRNKKKNKKQKTGTQSGA